MKQHDAAGGRIGTRPRDGGGCADSKEQVSGAGRRSGPGDTGSPYPGFHRNISEHFGFDTNIEEVIHALVPHHACHRGCLWKFKCLWKELKLSRAVIRTATRVSGVKIENRLKNDSSDSWENV